MKYKYYFLFSVLVIFSCKPVEKASEINYMQNIEAIAKEAAANNQITILQPGDQLMILITAKDNDVVKPYNQNYSSSEIVQNIAGAGNTPNSAISSVSGPTYLIDSDGDIDFSGIGTMHPAGKTLVEFKEEIRNEIRKYVINPTINIRLTNFKVNVMGEVARPGYYNIVEGQGTILNALSLAGDLTIYGKRDNVLVLRNENGQVTNNFINLKDANFLNSPFYNLKQGDVIVVSANKNREVTAKTNPNTGLYISIASVAVGALAIIISVFK
ncbi:polysaccharide biosynthesis/export family protein [Frigoriflavimonas asaccharolytica]|uniref:Polysaccharide export outer membrane protein n=1 Tax=Frigoriflavimonas asaccharolytica TaxID=2735899 RepID=A0A8J8G4Z3_9FLAO|nr:polysaccharide biosynthesis/export family protein [Frigoriflavimonas asaccharolytica]NRS91238.1 polysaccharide export outer membrane protein [Frigoriflavimonas asaccharolytica]